MSEVLIDCQNVGKKFSRSLNRSMFYGALDVLQSSVRILPKTEVLRKGEFWAVNDVSFELKRGEILGIVGPNGSGKTTLLRMLNGIFMPDKGRIRIKGKVGALIQVGAGFHPMLTGRENIYVNAAILGMTKAEIDKKFDAIVDFAGIADFLDAPVKHYSSGMYVRLGFSIAVHCEPDVLLIDEILSVGDSTFRQRCVEKMDEIKQSGVSIVFVSHDLYTVSKFCQSCIFLYEGDVKIHGETQKALGAYQEFINKTLADRKSVHALIPGQPECTHDVEITAVRCLDKKKKEKYQFATGDELGIRVEYNAKKEITHPIFQICIYNRAGVHVAIFATHIEEIQIDSINGEGFFECWIKELPVLYNAYYITVGIYDETHNVHIVYWDGSLFNQYFRILPNPTSQKMVDFTPICEFKREWSFNGKNIN